MREREDFNEGNFSLVESSYKEQRAILRYQNNFIRLKVIIKTLNYLHLYHYHNHYQNL